MKATVLGLVVAALLCGSRASAQDWQTLFNGRDLTGWQANNDAESFRVENGLLRIQSVQAGAAHLFFVGSDHPVSFKNFELVAVARMEPSANGGIFFHTDMTTRDAFKRLAKGYEVELNNTSIERRKTGSLYAVVDLDQSPIDDTRWFTVRLLVNDKRIRVYLDDQTVVDYTEPDGLKRDPPREQRLLSPQGGAIALQAHDDKSVMYFREIRIRPLP